MSSDRLFRRKDEKGRPVGPWLAWWYELGPDGKHERKQRSTKCYDRAAAEETYERWERDSANPERARASRATLGDAFTLLFNTRDEQISQGTRSEATLAMYKGKAARWLDALGEDYLLSSLTPAAIDAYISTRRATLVRPHNKPETDAPGEGRRISEHTLHKELVTLRAALKLAKRAGLFPGDIPALLPIGFAQSYKPRKRALTKRELDLLLAALPPDDAARVAFIVATSARWAETVAARREDIADSLTSVLLRGTKTDESERVVPIVTPAKPLLAYAKRFAAGTDGMLFAPRPNNVHRDLRRACARADIPPVTPNDLRRTFATWLREAGVVPSLIAPAMGHVDSKMVERVYGKLSAGALWQQLEQVVNPPQPPAAPAHNGTSAVSGAAQPRCSNSAAGRVHRPAPVAPVALPVPRRKGRGFRKSLAVDIPESLDGRTFNLPIPDSTDSEQLSFWDLA